MEKFKALKAEIEQLKAELVQLKAEMAVNSFFSLFSKTFKYFC